MPPNQANVLSCVAALCPKSKPPYRITSRGLALIRLQKCATQEQRRYEQEQECEEGAREVKRGEYGKRTTHERATKQAVKGRHGYSMKVLQARLFRIG